MIDPDALKRAREKYLAKIGNTSPPSLHSEQALTDERKRIVGNYQEVRSQRQYQDRPPEEPDMGGGSSYQQPQVPTYVPPQTKRTPLPPARGAQELFAPGTVVDAEVRRLEMEEKAEKLRAKQRNEDRAKKLAFEKQVDEGAKMTFAIIENELDREKRRILGALRLAYRSEAFMAFKRGEVPHEDFELELLRLLREEKRVLLMKGDKLAVETESEPRM